MGDTNPYKPRLEETFSREAQDILFINKFLRKFKSIFDIRPLVIIQPNLPPLTRDSTFQGRRTMAYKAP
jgi:hypothetical protein